MINLGWTTISPPAAGQLPDRNDDSNFLSFQMPIRIQRLARGKVIIRRIIHHK